MTPTKPKSALMGSPDLVEHITRGGILPPAIAPHDAEAVAAVDEGGTLLGILRPHRAGWRVRPNFVGRS